MEDFGYWLFLLVLYLLSAFMKKKKQKAAYRKLEEEDEKEVGWEAPEFVKELFSDFSEPEETKEEIVLPPEVDTVDHDVKLEPRVENKSEVPLEKIHKTHKDLSSKSDDRVGTLKRKSLKKEILKTSFFKKQHDVRMAMIYKEVLDKPRALRGRFR